MSLRIGILQQCFTRKGRPKKKFTDRALADMQAAREHKDVYQCKVCGQFHLTSQRWRKGQL